MSLENFGKIYLPQQAISLYLSNFSVEVSQLTDEQSYKNSELFGTSEPISQECLQIFLEKYTIQVICVILVRKWAN